MDLDTCTAFTCSSLAAKTPRGTGASGKNTVLIGNSLVVWGAADISGVVMYLCDLKRLVWKLRHVGVAYRVPFEINFVCLHDDRVVGVVIDIAANCRIFQFDAVMMDGLTEISDASESLYESLGCAVAFLEPHQEVVFFPSDGLPLWAWNVETRTKYVPRVSGIGPKQSKGAACSSCKNKVFLVVEQHDLAGIGLFILDAKKQQFTWSNASLAPGSYIPRPRRRPSVTCSSSKRVFVYGGYGAQDELVMYDFKEQKWFRIAKASRYKTSTNRLKLLGKTPAPSENSTAVQTNDFILLVGGQYGYKTNLLEISKMFQIRPAQ